MRLCWFIPLLIVEFYFLFLVRFIIVIVLLLGVFFIRLISFSKERIVVVESGFIRGGGVLGRFSLFFFLVIVLFVLFDLEILFLLCFFYSVFLKRFFLLFLGFLFLSLWLEWYWCQLVWLF